MSLVQDLIKSIDNNELSIQQIVRRAFRMSKLLKLDYISNLLDCELKGYEDDSDIPKYRQIEGTSHISRMGQWPNGALCEIYPPTDHDMCFLRASIHQLENYRQTGERIKVDSEFTLDLKQKVYVDYADIYISNNQLDNLIEQLKDRILRFAIELETKGILGQEDTTFSDIEIQHAKDNIIMLKLTIEGDMNQSSINIGEKVQQLAKYISK